MSLVSGKRHLLVQDISSAVASLGEACELLAVEFGDKAPECAEAYFYYGKALLEMFRLEAGVLGNIDAEGGWNTELNGSLLYILLIFAWVLIIAKAKIFMKLTREKNLTVVL